jgi:hypothetical protein
MASEHKWVGAIPIFYLAYMTCGCSHEPLVQNVASYIKGGYAQEVMLQMGDEASATCNIDPTHIQTSLISRSSDAKLVDGRIVSGKVVERWNINNCNNVHKHYIVTVKGDPSGMDDINVVEQLSHVASAN